MWETLRARVILGDSMDGRRGEDFDLERFLPPDERGRDGARRRGWDFGRRSTFFLAGVVFALGVEWVLDRAISGGRGPIDGRVVDEVAAIVSERFVDETDHQLLMVDALRGITDTLDSYSVYVSPDRYPEFVKDTEGEYVGIGVLLEPASEEADTLMVEGVLPGGPADRAGVRPGDIIVDANGAGVPAAGGGDRPTLRKRLVGPAGTVVRLRLRRGEDARELAVDVTRDQVTVPSVVMTSIVDPEHATGYVRILQFQSNTGREFASAMEMLERRGARALVLDLRGNPGGVFRAAIDLADGFLEEDAPIVATTGRAPEDGVARSTTYSAERDGPWVELPLVVLVDRDTASAAEIVAAAIRDNRRGVVVGERTFGKGRVQTIYTIRRKPEKYGLLKLTTQKFTSPSGRSIDRHDAEQAAAGAPAGDSEEDRDGVAAPVPGGRPGDSLALDDEGAGRESAGQPGAPVGGVAPDLELAQDDHASFVAALEMHFRERPRDPWRRAAWPVEAPDERPFEWTDPDTGEVHRDRQLVEAVALLADRERYDRLRGGDRARRGSTER